MFWVSFGCAWCLLGVFECVWSVLGAFGCLSCVFCGDVGVLDFLVSFGCVWMSFVDIFVCFRYVLSVFG